MYAWQDKHLWQLNSRSLNFMSFSGATFHHTCKHEMQQLAHVKCRVPEDGNNVAAVYLIGIHVTI